MDGKKHEIIAVGLLVLTLLTFFSLLSYHPSDLTFFSAATGQRSTENWIGGVGANVAYGLLFLFGLGAYALPWTGFYLSWLLFTGEGCQQISRTQLLGIALLIVSCISLGALHQPKVHLFGHEIFTGGRVGLIVAGFLARIVHRVGAHILLLGAFLVGLVLATPLTLGALAERLFDVCKTAWMRTVELVRRWKERREARKGDLEAPAAATAVEQKSLMLVSHPPPPVEVLPPPNIIVKKKSRSIPPPPPMPPVEGEYTLPSLSLLDSYEQQNHPPNWKKLEGDARVLEEKLSDFGVQGKVVGILPGPVITMYEYAPAPGIKISRIVGLSDDLSMALKATSIRVVAPIPGKAAIGIEIPNLHREMVSLRAVLEAEVFAAAQTPLTIALGKDITGQAVSANLGKMPHLLIAGATGTGKSVCINALLSSLLYRNTPRDLRLLLIDPKRIELNTYEGIPHLIHPVVTDAKMATRALRWAVQEMELRYRLLAEKSVRNIEGYNRALAKEKAKEKPVEPRETDEESNGRQLTHRHLPYMVIIIDELADLMMVASREVEESITRLAQMARAAGIHLILATQRPSVDVLTGIIKANVPTRISFQVSSRIDSRTILDGSGAESLLGMGDMLFLPPGTAKIQRIHGAYVSDNEVQQITEFWRSQQLLEDPLAERVDFHEPSASEEVDEEEVDEKYEEAIQIVRETRQASISMLQRRLRVGYNRAARMIEMMEQQGIVSTSDGVKPREVIGSRQ
ncbi:MAG: DNA translocase FtsK [Syntrophobacteraceae bacterium]